MKFIRLNKRILFFAWIVSLTPLIALEQDESLAVRRIATCYYEKDFKFSKRLIEDFFTTYPTSPHTENLYLLLADVYFQEKDWNKALSLYQMLESPSLKEESFIQKLHCYYSLKNFHLLRKVAEPKLEQLTKFSDSDKNMLTFYYAEALFKEDPEGLDSETQEKILSLYQSLLSSPLSSYVKLSMAHLYSLQKKHSISSQYFLECSEAFPEMKEKLLFFAAENQSHFDLNISSNTFFQIKEQGYSKSGDAIYNWLVLLFHSENFQDILNAKNEILEKVPASKKSSAHLILGKTYFNQKKFPEALAHLQESLQYKKINPKEHKEVIFLSSLCSYYLNDELKFDSYFSTIEKKYKLSEEYPKTLFLKGKLLQQKQAYSKAQTYFNKASKFRSSNILEASIFESALCHFQQKQFQKSHDSFHKFLLNFKENQYVKSAAYYLLQSSSELYQIKATSKIKEQLIEDYLLTLKIPDFFENNAIADVYIKIGKLYLDLGQYQKVYALLTTFLDTYPESPKNYQANLILALAYRNEQHDLEKYIGHLKKAAECEVSKDDLNAIYLHLFQAYSQLAKENENKNIPFTSYLENAAYYLNQAIKQTYSVPKKHFLWLSQFYFQRLGNNISTMNPFLNEAYEIMSHYLETYPEIESIQEQHLRFNYSKVLGWQGKYKEKINMLKANTEKLDPSQPLYIQSMLELGLSYELLNETTLAIKTYEDIISSYSYSIPVITFTAKLRLARLLTHKYLTSYSPDLFSKISQYYQDLHIARSLKSEPLHLEAALDYALFQNIHDLHKSDYQAYLQTLIKLKDNFSNRDNLLSREYHELREHYPDKNKLYEAYMMFVDAKILHLQAKINMKKNEMKKADEKIELAKNLIERLQNKNESLTPYLKQVALLEQEAIKKETLSFDFLSSYLMEGINHEL